MLIGSVDTWPMAIKLEILAALCAIGMGKDIE